MKRSLTVVAPLVFFSVVLGTHPVLADAGVFTGNGQSLHQITSKTVQLVSIDVDIIPGRGPFLFDGGVAGMDRTEYQCKFVLRSLSNNAEEVQVGFPVDSEFARQSEPGSAADAAAASSEWVLDYGFIARDENNTYHVDFVRRKPKDSPGEFASIFVWKMHFAPNETKTLSVYYHIPTSMGFTSTNKEEGSDTRGKGAFRAEQLDLALLEMIGYITSTGSSWAGNVERATFTVLTEPFEQYLTRRGVTEVSEAGEQAGSPFLVQHPWWFRTISPSGWKEVKGGVQWNYKDYKPQDSILVKYYVTQIPQRPDEVDAFVDGFLKRLDPGDSPSAELLRVKNVLLAIYGNEPQDTETKAFVGEQLWYAPRKDFSMVDLSPAQKANLNKLDHRISLARVTK